MDPIYTLTQLLENSHCDYRIFDLGRRIQLIDNHVFSKIEQEQQPYPFPLLRQAHFAIAYWNEEKQPWIWFLKFQLDERGLLQSTHINQFIQYIIEALGTQLNQSLTEEQQQKLANNPYTYKPSEEKMAVFHSQLRAHLKLPTSQYYVHAQRYFKGELGWSNWQNVGLQGITDICARLEQDNNNVMIYKALQHLPHEPLYALLGALEHTSPLADKLAQRLQTMALAECQKLSNDINIFLIAALVRALSAAEPTWNQILIKTILENPNLSHQEILIAIAGRSWQQLNNKEMAEQFLIRLAQTNNQSLFNQLFADLVMLPSLRIIFLPLLHSSPSNELSNALKELQKMVGVGNTNTPSYSLH